MAKNIKKPKIAGRIIFLTAAICVCFVVLAIRVGFIQFVRGTEYKAAMLEQETRDKEITPRRGSIFDANGKELAVSASVDTVVLDPRTIKKVGNADKVAHALSTVLEVNIDKIYKLINKDSSFEYVKKRISTPESETLRAYISGKNPDGTKMSDADKERYDLSGVSLIADSKRYYPYGELASQLIGTTGADNQGLDGLEYKYDKYLKGTAGKIVKADTTAGSPSFEYEQFYNAQSGNNIKLTIDETIQRIVEKHLKEVYVENAAAKGGSAIVMNPNTGEILAMASIPTHNLNEPIKIEDPLAELLSDEEYNKLYVETASKLKRNKPVVDVYEPGSTFKLITCAMALEENVTTLEEQYTCNGYMHIGGHSIGCWKTAGHGTTPFLQGMVNSCNPTLMQVGMKIGKENFYKNFQLFGFDKKTGIDYPGEAIGAMHDYEAFGETDLCVSSFGQSFEVTPLQMVTAISSLVNGGTLYKPYIVKEIQTADGQIVESFSPEKVRQTISPETSEKMKYVMERVVIDSGSTAAVKGYRVGGKSGTSEKQPRGSGKYIGSFVGVAPIDNPQIICMVILDEPTGENYYGGVITAPAAGGIIKDVMQYYGIEPQYTEAEKAQIDTTVPDVTGKTPDEAKNAIVSFGLDYTVRGKGNVIVSQQPKAGEKVKSNTVVYLYAGDKVETTQFTVPDVVGKTVEEANTIITNAGLKIKITNGAGQGKTAVVKGQSPAAGTQSQEGGTVEIIVEENIEE